MRRRAGRALGAIAARPRRRDHGDVEGRAHRLSRSRDPSRQAQARRASRPRDAARTAAGCHSAAGRPCPLRRRRASAAMPSAVASGDG